MRLKSIVFACCGVASVGPVTWAAEPFGWTVDSSQSLLTTTLSATLGTSSLSDSETNQVAGTIGGTLGLPASNFETIHLTTADLNYTTNPNFALTVPIFGGVTVTTNGLGFAIPGPNNIGFAASEPVIVDSAGAFSQLNNGAEGRGTLTYTGVGILGNSVGTGTINLVDQGALPMDWNGTITQNGTQLQLTIPVSVDQTSVQNDIPVRVQVSGNVRANATTNAGGWKVDASGTWGAAGNWSSSVAPQSQTAIDTAVFGSVITAPRTISFTGGAGSQAVRRVLIASDVAYALGDGLQLAPSTAGEPTSIEVLRGTGHSIARVGSATAASIQVEAGAVVTITQLESTGALRKTGDGVVTISNGSSGALTIDAGTVRLQNALRVTDSLTTGSSGTLDLGTAQLQVDYVVTPATVAVAALRAEILKAYAGGTWAGNGVTSSLLPGDGRKAIGYGDSAALSITLWGGQPMSGAALAAVTFKGDTNLDFDVDFDDLLKLAQKYGTAGTWMDGDFNYDGAVNFDDLLGLAQSYGSSLSVAEQSQLSADFVADFRRAQLIIPEPTMIMTLIVPACLRRRRRSPVA